MGIACNLPWLMNNSKGDKIRELKNTCMTGAHSLYYCKQAWVSFLEDKEPCGEKYPSSWLSQLKPQT